MARSENAIRQGTVTRSQAAARALWRRDAAVALFILPALLLYGVYLLYPLAASIWYSLLQWNGISKPIFIGLGNWQHLLGDSDVLGSLRNTAIILAGSLLEIPFGLAIALAVNRLGRIGVFLSTIYIIPVLISSVAIGITWATLYNPQFGPLYYIFNAFNQQAPALIGTASTVVWAITAVVLWQYVPSYILLFNAGLLGIPHDLYDAAAIDGAGIWASFRHITVPLLKKTFVTALVLIIVGSLTYFDLIYIMSSGGPGTASYTLALYVYHAAFQQQDIGYGSTIAVLLFVLSIVISGLLIRFSRLISEQ
jgi:raffinose/stachyose/melibiose transport system permease protein